MTFFSFEMHLYSYFANLFKTFTQSLGIQYHQGDVVVGVGVVAIPPTIGLVGTELKVYFGL